MAGICHRIAILHEGQIVECGTTERIFTDPQHPYSGRLIAALPARLGRKVPRVSAATPACSQARRQYLCRARMCHRNLICSQIPKVTALRVFSMAQRLSHSLRQAVAPAGNGDNLAPSCF